MMGEYGYGGPSSGSLYGGHRPTFNEDGTGMPYNALLNMVGSAVLNQDISYDTSSKDPTMVRARVFIGNLVRAGITRDDLIDLCKPYGKLLAVTFFKGYAFVQFSEAKEADSACAQLNGKRWKGAIIDVHLAMTGPQFKKKAASEDLGRKRRHDDYTRDDTANVLDETAEQNRRNRDYAMTDRTCNDDLAESAMADTLICGSCRFVTCDYEIFKDHRIAGCKTVRADNEPKAMRCASCNQRFLSAWALMCHLTDFHRMQLYREEEIVKQDEEATPAKRAPTPIASYTPIENSQPLTEIDQVNCAPQAPIGTGSTGGTNTPEDSQTPTKNSLLASVAIESPQWNPMTGQTIPGIHGLVDTSSLVDPGPQAIPSLGAVYGMR